MRLPHPFSTLVAAALIAGSTTLAHAATAKTYQVTGAVIESTPTLLVVDKDGERWEIARSAETRGAEEVKPGQKVTIHYRMTATKVEARDAGASATEPRAPSTGNSTAPKSTKRS